MLFLLCTEADGRWVGYFLSRSIEPASTDDDAEQQDYADSDTESHAHSYDHEQPCTDRGNILIEDRHNSNRNKTNQIKAAQPTDDLFAENKYSFTETSDIYNSLMKCTRVSTAFYGREKMHTVKVQAKLFLQQYSGMLV